MHYGNVSYGRQKSFHTQFRIIFYISYILLVKNIHNFSQYAVEKLTLTYTHSVPLIWMGTSNLSSSVGYIFTLFKEKTKE
jgi:hypothetical protein